MSRLGILTALALFAAIPSARADQQVWTIQNWPGDIDLIPCSAWSKTSDGTWVLHGAVKLGGETMSNEEFERAGGNQSAVHVDHSDENEMRIGPTLEAFLISLDCDADFLHRVW